MDGVSMWSLQDHNRVAVIGLGETGFSVIRYLHALGKDIYAMDHSSSPRCLDRVRECLPDNKIQLVDLNEELLSAMDLIVVSPGVDLSQPLFIRLRGLNKIICSDVELFCQVNEVPIIAVTGSNGKTTLTTMITQSLLNLGKKAIAAGNIGYPVLDTLSHTDLDYVVLELSSFQLESLSDMHAEVAILLNCTPDHLDRHKTMEAYYQAKLRIYKQAKHAVYNQGLGLGDLQAFETTCSFGDSPAADFYISNEMVMLGGQPVCSNQSWLLHGKHHYQNALALFSVMHVLQLPIAGVISVLKEFSGIKHRCQKVAEINGVSWYNDSKATNEGACIAAVQTLSSQTAGSMILLLGGDSKGASFLALKSVVYEHVSVVITFGQASETLANLLGPVVDLYRVGSMSAAVNLAHQLSSDQDVVLLSPACASFDMFNNYQHRGEMFSKYIQEVSV
jgi:UDP-N-acetylmuramoylalanine--D-glutamate ligase